MVQVNASKGFTLIELIIVMALVIAAAAIITPNLWSTLNRFQEHQAVQDYALSLHKMRYESRKTGQPVHFAAVPAAAAEQQAYYDYQPYPAVNDGWSLERATTMTFLPTGVATVSKQVLRSPSNWLWEIHFHSLDGNFTIQRTDKSGVQAGDES